MSGTHECLVVCEFMKHVIKEDYSSNCMIKAGGNGGILLLGSTFRFKPG